MSLERTLGIHEVQNLRVALAGEVTVSSGKGISDAEILGGCALLRVNIPGDWVATSAPSVSLLVSEDGDTYRPVYYWDSAAPSTPALASITVSTGVSYAIPSSWTEGAYAVKVVSGTVGTTTPVEGDHVVGLVYRLV